MLDSLARLARDVRSLLMRSQPDEGPCSASLSCSPERGSNICSGAGDGVRGPKRHVFGGGGPLPPDRLTTAMRDASDGLAGGARAPSPAGFEDA